MQTIRYEAMGGELINNAIKAAIALAKEKHCTVESIFNGVTILVESDSDVGLIMRDWHRALSGYIPSPVGPYPVETLTAAELDSDAGIEAKNEARRAAEQAKWAEQEAKDKAAKAAALADAPAMDRDETKWLEGSAAQKDDGYGLAIYDFAQDWARLMQRRIAAGEKIADIADDCCSLADKGVGITGFMYGAAVHVLAGCWKHGDELREWHNSKYGRPGITGTVNPAVLIIGADEAAA